MTFRGSYWDPRIQMVGEHYDTQGFEAILHEYGKTFPIQTVRPAGYDEQPLETVGISDFHDQHTNCYVFIAQNIPADRRPGRAEVEALHRVRQPRQVWKAWIRQRLWAAPDSVRTTTAICWPGIPGTEDYHWAIQCPHTRNWVEQAGQGGSMHMLVSKEAMIRRVLVTGYYMPGTEIEFPIGLRC